MSGKGIVGLAKSQLVSLPMAAPGYLINNVVVLFLLWYFQTPGIGNIPFVWVGDIVGYVIGVSLWFFVWSKSTRLRKLMGSNERTVCPHCGGHL